MFNQLTMTQSNSNPLVSMTAPNEGLASLTGIKTNLMGATAIPQESTVLPKE